MEHPAEFRSGFVAVIGRPNVGKSTLMNKLIGQKIAIMSDKPQTTRNKVFGVLTLDDSQIIFIDTPGMHKPKHKLGEYMLKAAETALKEVDVILMVVDATSEIGAGDHYILNNLKNKNLKTPIILGINKIDKIPKENILSIIEKYRTFFNFSAIVPLSALTGLNLEALLDEIKVYLPNGPKYYPDDTVTDQPERLIISELIREKAIHLTKEELPHVLLVDIEEISVRANNTRFVRAVIYVERESQKGIIIGSQGKMLKEIGRKARIDIETLLDSKVYLDLWVKVKKDWRNKDSLLKMLGFNG